MSKIIAFGESVQGFSTPVLNEREIRASAGMFFLAMLISLMLILFQKNFLPFKYMITVFLTDFLIRVFVNPRFAPSLIIGRMIVGNQTPEYVGAPPKKVAWSIGLVLAVIMFSLLVVVNAYSPITGIICLICLIFLFFESAFGICLGCKFYSLFHKEPVQHCPGDVCEVRTKQEIQKTSGTQTLIVLGAVLYLLLAGFLFNDQFRKAPYDLFGIQSTSQSK